MEAEKYADNEILPEDEIDVSPTRSLFVEFVQNPATRQNFMRYLAIF